MTPGGSSGRGAPGAGGRGAPSFALVVAITLTGIMGNVVIVPALPDIAADLGVPASRGGLLLAAGTAPGIVVAPVIGLLADRFGRRAVLLPCLVLFGLAGGLGGLAPSFGALLALRLLQGVGSAGLINLAVVIITDHWDGVERARRIGRNAAALTASLVILPPLGGLLAAIGGWRATFLPFWIGLVTAGFVAVGLPGRGPGGPGPRGAGLRGAIPAVVSRGVLAPMALGFCVFVLIFALLSTAPAYLDDRFGLAVSSRGLLLGLPALTATAAALSLGRLRARVARRRLVVAGLLLFTVGFTLIGVAPALAVVAAGLLAYGLGEGLLVATLQDTVAGAAPPASRGTVVATWVGFARAGQTVGPVAAGAGQGALEGRAPFLAAAAAALVLAGLARWVPSTPPPAVPSPSPPVPPGAV